MRDTGFVLLTTLLIMMLMSLIVATQGQLIFMQLKSLNRLRQHTYDSQQLETAAGKAINYFSNNNYSCLVNELSSKEILTKLQSKKGCMLTYNHINYYYIIETLGNFPCINAYVNAKKYSTKHWRLTITQVNLNKLLQLRIATLINSLPCIAHQKITIKPGIQSWREIDYQQFIL